MNHVSKSPDLQYVPDFFTFVQPKSNNMIRPPKKHCLECGDELMGRVDKKFCNDQCRTTYYRKQNLDAIHLIQDINNQLKKNRAILLQFNKTGKATVRKSKLDKAGFNFSLYTSSFTTKEGRNYYFNYDQGYAMLENDFVLLVVHQDYRKEE